MTAQRDLKKRIRARMARTGEAYTAAREHVLRARDEDDGTACDEIVEAIVLKANQRSARVRLVDEPGEVTLCASGLPLVAPAQIATIHLSRRWTWRGDAYASGELKEATTDVARLGLTPLPLTRGPDEDHSEYEEGYGSDERLAALWARHTGRPRLMLEFHSIAWEGRRAAEAGDPDDAPISEAAEAWARGEHAAARAAVMEVLADDLRCIDGHAHLGNWVVDRSPTRALVHYEIGIAIGEISLRAAPPDHVLPWSMLYNRPFLRCLHGKGLALWRLERFSEAAAVFERVCSLNPLDNQGARFCWLAAQSGERWKDFVDDEDDDWVDEDESGDLDAMS